MTPRAQKRFTIGGVLVLVVLFATYKGYMVTVAFTSQTACVLNETATGAPAQRAC